MKVLTVVGTRPELIKLSRVIAELDRTVQHVLVHTGQNYDYELNEIFFDELGIRRPDHVLNVAGSGPAQSIAKVIAEVDKILASEMPDAFLVLGDTNSALSVLAAKRRKIPTFHMEAGNRCFDERVPEEINRRLVDHASDINLPYSDIAREYLLAEGLPPDRVIKTGSPMREVLDAYRPKIDASEAVKRLDLEPGKYFVVSAHREENVDAPAALSKLLDAVEAVAAEYRLPIVFSTHPRTRARLEALSRAVAKEIHFLKPLGFPDYVALERAARCVLSDSGTLTEESSILGFPAVSLREAHERPEGMQEGTLIMSGLSRQSVLDAVRTTLIQFDGGYRPRMVPDYEITDVSRKVARILCTYTDYVNRRVWFK